MTTQVQKEAPGYEAGVKYRETVVAKPSTGGVPGTAGLLVRDKGLRGLRDATVSAGATVPFAIADQLKRICALADILAAAFSQGCADVSCSQ